MPRFRGLFVSALFALAFTSSGFAGGDLAPEFPHSSASQWINSQPLSLSELRGRPVLVEFWTFDCVNCLRTLPWLKAMHDRYADAGLVIVSVHTPEFEHERDVRNIRAAVDRLGIRYPVMLDNDFSYWKAMRNQYWPAFYVIDRQGRISASAIGELHEGHARADDFERKIAQALARK